MKTRSEPFLWIHLGGIVMFPLFFLLTALGLAVGKSYSYWLEVPILTAVAILPVLLMQLYRPFNIFSVLLFSLKPQILTADRRRILALFQRKQQKLVNAIASILMLLALWLIYNLSPAVAGIAELLPQSRLLGLAIASVAFFGSNLFLQIPLNALQVLLIKESELEQIELYTPEAVESSFTTPGIQLSQIPFLSTQNSTAEEIN